MIFSQKPNYFIFSFRNRHTTCVSLLHTYWARSFFPSWELFDCPLLPNLQITLQAHGRFLPIVHDTYSDILVSCSRLYRLDACQILLDLISLFPSVLASLTFSQEVKSCCVFFVTLSAAKVPMIPFNCVRVH